MRLWALSLASALLQLLPFPIAGPAPLWRRIFCWVCLIPLLYALLGHTREGKNLGPLQAALLSYGCGVVWYMGNCYWIYRTMHIYESIPAAASFGILLLFALYVGLYHALFGGLIGLLHARYSRTLVLLAAPFLWAVVELARARITGFPWDLLGYTQVDDRALTPLATLTGVMGLSFVIVAVNALSLMRIEGRNRSLRYAPAGAAALLTIIATLFTVLRNPRPAEPTQAVATLLQENLSVGMERAAAPETRQQMLRSFSQLSLHPAVGLTAKGPRGDSLPDSSPVTLPGGRSQLIVWPEAPTDFVDSDPQLREAISALARQTATPVIVNDVTFASAGTEGRPNLYNSASFYLADGTYAGHYDKMHLVPFGEYTPYKPLFFFVGHLLDDLIFVPGTERTLFKAQGKSYGVFICYESIFGDDMRQFARHGAAVLVNISDDGWYGDTSAPWEHLDMVRMRAIESRRWVIRATNTGITAAIDPFGRITTILPRHIRSSIQVAFGYRNDLTLYARYGDWFGWFCVLVAVAMIAAGYARPRRVASSKVN